MEQLVDRIIRTLYESFKLDEVFSKQEDIYLATVELAYRDAQRTLRGIGEFSNVKDSAIRDISFGIGEYVNGLRTEQSFDSIHHELCELWTNRFNGELGAYGKAQKIVNMSFKYLYTYYYQSDDKRLERLSDCHFTLDSYTLEWLNICGVADKPAFLDSETCWSRLNINAYEAIQEYSTRCISEVVPGLNRIKAEFLVWETVRIHEMTKTWATIDCNSNHNPLIDVAKESFTQDEKCSLMQYMNNVLDWEQR